MTALVLMYHRIAASDIDCYGLCVHPERFAAQVEELATRAVVPLNEVLGPSRAPRIAITFDDGYADNAEVAAPILDAAEHPATFFITTGTLGGTRFWWDRLAVALLGGGPMPAGIDVTLGGRALWVDLSSVEARRNALWLLRRRLLALPPDELSATADRIVAALGAHAPSTGDQTMTVGQLRELAAGRLVEIGAHTRTHARLGAHHPDLQEHEIAGSIADLTALLGQPVTSFAYPFGGRDAIGRRAPRLVRDAGCSLACSTEPGPVPQRVDRYRLPRLAVGDWDRAEFAARVDRLLAAA